MELYLRKYFDTVAVDPSQDRLAISLVDGFSGGGKYRAPDGSDRLGSPFVLINAVSEAAERLNRERVKPLTIEPKFYFVDADASALAYLSDELAKSGYRDEMLSGSISLQNNKFEPVAATIVADIKARHRAGRSLFVLDQKGWSAVQFSTIRFILEQLPRAEVILTFAVDWLITYMNDGVEFRLALERAGFAERQIHEYLSARGLPGYEYLIPRLLQRDIQELTGAAFFSAFFIRSATAGRDLWIVHLSKLTTARNVMVDAHWKISNADTIAAGSIHQGKAGTRMLGFDPHWENALPFEFSFDQSAAGAMSNALKEELPGIVAVHDGDPPTLDLLHAQIANQTAATKEQIEQALLELHEANEVDLLTPGGQRKRGASLLKTDRVQIPRQGRLRV